MEYGTLIVEDVEYRVMLPFDTTFDERGTRFTAEGQMRAVILCEHCKNFRLEPIELYTVDELISCGWIKKKE